MRVHGCSITKIVSKSKGSCRDTLERVGADLDENLEACQLGNNSNGLVSCQFSEEGCGRHKLWVRKVNMQGLDLRWRPPENLQVGLQLLLSSGWQMLL